jgi:hypothetical protein
MAYRSRTLHPWSSRITLAALSSTDGKLTIYPADHFAGGAQARVVLEPFLRAWEVESDLSRNIGSIRFNYTHVRKVDRNPRADFRKRGRTSVGSDGRRDTYERRPFVSHNPEHLSSSALRFQNDARGGDRVPPMARVS